MYKFILGSNSPRRSEFTNYLNIPFKIIVPDIEEKSLKTIPSEIAQDIAIQKANEILRQVVDKKKLVVLTADTIVVLQNKIYGKPKDEKEARLFLKELSGKTHQVITAVCLVIDEEFQSFFVSTEVKFRDINESLLSNYLATKDSLDKAGAYGIQGPSLTFIESITGSYSNVVGLPLDHVVLAFIKKWGVNWQTQFIS